MKVDNMHVGLPVIVKETGVVGVINIIVLLGKEKIPTAIVATSRSNGYGAFEAHELDLA